MEFSNVATLYLTPFWEMIDDWTLGVVLASQPLLGGEEAIMANWSSAIRMALTA